MFTIIVLHIHKEVDFRFFTQTFDLISSRLSRVGKTVTNCAEIFTVGFLPSAVRLVSLITIHGYGILLIKFSIHFFNSWQSCSDRRGAFTLGEN